MTSSIPQLVSAMEQQAKNNGIANDNWLGDQQSIVRANGYDIGDFTDEEAGVCHTYRVQYSCNENRYYYTLCNIPQPNRKAFIRLLTNMIGE